MKNLYRLYIDEVGNHDMKPGLGENERFLSLFGVIVNGEQMLNQIQPDMRRLKINYFQQDPDEPVIFHRKDIVKYRRPFNSLYADKEKRRAFADEMLAHYQRWPYTAIIITIDKIAHQKTYTVWRYAPYHYCLETMLERYVLFLHYRKLRGDVMIEARGTKPDHKLADSFQRMVEKGTRHITAEIMQNCLTSKKLKIKTKKANIAGLQLADLLAHAAHYDHLADHKLVDKQNSQYARQVAAILNQSKYNRSRSGRIQGYGKKLLP